jgi:hypothetical protein
MALRSAARRAGATRQEWRQGDPSGRPFAFDERLTEAEAPSPPRACRRRGRSQLAAQPFPRDFAQAGQLQSVEAILAWTAWRYAGGLGAHTGYPYWAPREANGHGLSKDRVAPVSQRRLNQSAQRHHFCAAVEDGRIEILLRPAELIAQQAFEDLP